MVNENKTAGNTDNLSKKEQLKQYLYDQFIKDTIIPTALKPYDLCVKEAKSRLDALLDKYIKEILDGEQLFRDKVHPDEKEQLETTLAHATQESNIDLPTEFADEQFLEKIAKRELSQEHNEEASALFLTLIHLYPEYSSAWIGHAIAEQLLNRNDNAEQIYLDALEFMPWDEGLRLYAVRFYISVGKKAEAKKLIEEVLTKMNEQGKQESEPRNRFKALLQYC